MRERRLHRQRLAGVPGMILEDIRAEGGTPAWSPVDLDEGHAVILIRRGGFLRHCQGEEAFVDPSGGYISQHGVEERFAYPLGGPDHCTLIGLTPEAYHEHVEPLSRQSWRLTTDTSFDLRHRLFLSACRQGVDQFEAAEGLLILLGSLSATKRNGDAARPSTHAAHRHLVAAVQEALAQGHLKAGLAELAAAAGSSPHHLSRVFRRLTGQTISAYRNDLRVRRVLEDIMSGASNLASLAATYGFADQAHLSRTVRRHLATSPTALRRKLSIDVQATEAATG